MSDQKARAGNLTAVLALLAVGELVVHRVADRLFIPITGAARTGGTSALGTLGWFLFHLTGVLGLTVLIAGLTGALLRRELFPRPLRVGVIVIWGVFVALAGRRILFPGFGGFLPHLEIGFAFLSFTIVAAILGATAPWRAKVGVILAALPGMLSSAAVVANAASGSGLRALPISPTVLARAGEAALLTVGITAPFLLAAPARPGARWRRRTIIASSVAGGLFAGLLIARADLVEAVVFYAVHLTVPALPSLLSVLYVLALMGAVAAIVHLLSGRGGSRLAGYGLALLVLAGYQATGAVELVLATTGLLALALGQVRAATAPDVVSEARAVGADEREWQRYGETLVQHFGRDGARTERVEVEEDGRQLLRIQAVEAGMPLALRVVRVRGAACEMEVLLGEPGHGEPDAAVASRVARGARAVQRALRTALSPAVAIDPPLNGSATLFGHVPPLDESLRTRLAALTGLVTIWSGRAARYQAAFPSSEPTRDPLQPGPDGALDASRTLDIVGVLAALMSARQGEPAQAVPPVGKEQTSSEE